MKTEAKLVLVAAVVFLILSVILGTAIFNILTSVASSVDNNGGVKAVVERIWEGKK